MDKWILAATNSLIEFVRKEMEGTEPVITSLNIQLTDFTLLFLVWWNSLNSLRIGMSAWTERDWRDQVELIVLDLTFVGGSQDCKVALSTLFEVIYTITKAMVFFVSISLM